MYKDIKLVYFKVNICFLIWLVIIIHRSTPHTINKIKAILINK